LSSSGRRGAGRRERAKNRVPSTGGGVFRRKKGGDLEKEEGKVSTRRLPLKLQEERIHIQYRLRRN